MTTIEKIEKLCKEKKLKYERQNSFWIIIYENDNDEYGWLNIIVAEDKFIDVKIYDYGIDESIDIGRFNFKDFKSLINVLCRRL